MRTLNIKGLNLKRFLNELIEKKITPKKVFFVSHEEINIEISNREYKKLVDLKSSTCYNITVVKNKPDKPLFYFFIARCGLFVGLAMALFLLFSLTSKIWKIDISVLGEENSQLVAEVEGFLASKGIEVGKPLELDTRELEKEILKSNDLLSGVVIKKTGISLDIKIKPRVKEPSLSEECIVSKYSGKITDINHSSGILTVNIGEGVSAGQVLIASGYVGDYYAEASGEVYAKVLISGKAVGGLQTETVYRTGAVTEIHTFEIWGREILADKVSKINSIYQNCEIEKEEIFISENMVLPLKKVVYRVFELQSKQNILNKEELIEDLKNKAYQNAKNSLPEGAKEQSIKYDVFENNGFFTVVCNIETEISIGVRK